MRVRFAVIAVAVLGAGCTHTHLHHNSLRQTATVTQLQQQQVVDNLAMFCANPDALPFFSVPGTGTVAVSDSLGGSSTLNYSRVMFSSLSLTFGGFSRALQHNWSLAPISDPDKLMAMRCAYQYATGHAERAAPCVTCCELDKQWQGNPNAQCPDCCRTPGPGWYCVGGKHDVPRDACYVGRYGDTHVWVLPDGMDELTRLTMTILDYATLAAQAPPAQHVERIWKPIYDKPAGDPKRRIIQYELVETRVRTVEPAGPAGYVADPQLPPRTREIEDAIQELSQARERSDLEAERVAKQKLERAERSALEAVDTELRALPGAAPMVVPLRARENFYEPLRGLINLN